MLAYDPAGEYPDAEVIERLRSVDGVRELNFWYELLDKDNNGLGELFGVTEGKISYNALASISRSASFRIRDDAEIDFLSNRIRPWARLTMKDGGAVNWPLGVFLLSSPNRSLEADSGIVWRDIEAFDQTIVLQDESPTNRYALPAGTVVTTQLRAILNNRNLKRINIESSSVTLPAAMEWEPGSSYLRIVNDLLGAIGYEAAFFDENGYFIGRPYRAPSDRAPELDYRSDEDSVILPNGLESTVDLYDVANSWVLTVSEADRPALRATYQNVNPGSPTSIPSKGRTITDYRDETEAATQAVLDAKVKRLAFEASQIYEAFEFDTLIMPIHGHADILEVVVPEMGISGKYSEHTWEFPLDVGGKMSHRVRRVVTV